MKKTVLGLLTGGLLLASAASPALAAGPATVRLRVESTVNGALVPPATVTTTTAPVVKDGNPADSCTGTSAAGALELATGGDWSGAWGGASMGYEVDRIKTEDFGPFASNPQYYWALAVNGVSADSGVCGVELRQGDDVVLYTGCAGATSGCFDSTVLALTAPATVAPGQPFSVSATATTTDFPPPSYAKQVSHQPAAGATVTAAGATATTGADGSAALTLGDRGPATIRVTHGNDVPDQVAVCVTDGHDGFCGTTATAPGTAPAPQPAPQQPSSAPPCRTTGDDGRCGSPDHRAAYGFITSIREGQRYARHHGPRQLAGRVDDEPSGIKDVQLRLTRSRHWRHCMTYDGARERLVHRRHCGARHGRWFSVGDRSDWTYLLPKRLPRGRYVLDVRVTDDAGNRDATLARGRNRVVFYVG